MSVRNEVFGFVVEHRFRKGIWAHSNGEVRSWPTLFDKREHAEQAREKITPNLLAPDFAVVPVLLMFAEDKHHATVRVPGEPERCPRCSTTGPCECY